MEDIKIIPQIRFKDKNGNIFPDWEDKLIGNILTVGSGKDYKHLSKGNIPVYGTGGYMLSVNQHLYEGDSVCIGRKGTIDKPMFLTGKFWTVDTLFYTHNYIKAIPFFVYMIFQNIIWKKYNEASGVPSLSKKTIEKIEIKIPCLLEQKQIAEFLSEVDKKIELLTKKKRGLENYKKGIMQKIFNQEIRFKDDNGNDYPDWEEITLGNVGNIITGSTPATKIKEYYNGNKLFVSPADIEKSRYISETKTTLTTLGFSKGRLVKQNSVLFVCIGSTIGKLIQVTEDCITNQQINSIITFDKFSSDFLYSLLEFNAIKIKNLAGVQAVPMINKTTFSKIKLNFPSFDEQVGIANYLIEFDNKINQLERQLSNIKRYKKGLLQQMFV